MTGDEPGPGAQILRVLRHGVGGFGDHTPDHEFAHLGGEVLGGGDEFSRVWAAFAVPLMGLGLRAIPVLALTNPIRVRHLPLRSRGRPCLGFLVREWCDASSVEDRFGPNPGSSTAGLGYLTPPESFNTYFSTLD